MTVGLPTSTRLKPRPKRSRKLPRREILDTDIVLPSTNRAIDDLLLERAPSHNDRAILSELWGGNATAYNTISMPAVSIGKPKGSTHIDNSTKSKSYKDMLKEKQKNIWKMDLSNLTFVPLVAQGKHIRRSASISSHSPEISKDASPDLQSVEQTTEAEDMEIDDRVESTIGNKTNDSDTESRSKVNQNKLSLLPQEPNSLFSDNQDLQESSPMTTNDHSVSQENLTKTVNNSTGYYNKDYSQDFDDLNEDSYGHSDGECMVDIVNMVENLQQVPDAVEKTTDLNETEIAPTVDDEILQEPTTETEPEACLENNHGGGEPDHRHHPPEIHVEHLPENSMPSTLTSSPLSNKREEKQIIPMQSTEFPLTDAQSIKMDQQVIDDQQDVQQTGYKFEIPTVQQFLSASETSVPDEKPLLNLNPPTPPAQEITNNHTRANPADLNHRYPRRKRHRLLRLLKRTTALDWLVNEKDDPTKKKLGQTRKRQLQARFNKPSLTKKVFKGLWTDEE